MVIDVRKKNSSSDGSYCDYYDLGKGIGLKVLHQMYHKKYIKKFYQEAMRDFKNGGYYDWQMNDATDASQEFAILQMLSKSNKVPKVFGTCWVKTDRRDLYRIGIIMEHINGKTVEQSYNEEIWNKFLQFENKSVSWGKRYGVVVQDWHDGNVMVRDNGKLVRIDFSPDCCDIQKPKTFKRITKENFISLFKSFP